MAALEEGALTVVGEYIKEHWTYTLNVSSPTIIAREDDKLRRINSEAIKIHCQATTISKDSGHKLPVIYLDILSHDKTKKSGT